MLKVLIGLITPYIGILGALPWVTSVAKPVVGMPFAYLWMFTWFLLTAGCLGLCYRLFDANPRHTEVT